MTPARLLVERLRGDADWIDGSETHTADLEREAAARIEALETALEGSRSGHAYDVKRLEKHIADLTDALTRARAACAESDVRIDEGAMK